MDYYGINSEEIKQPEEPTLEGKFLLFTYHTTAIEHMNNPVFALYHKQKDATEKMLKAFAVKPGDKPAESAEGSYNPPDYEEVELKDDEMAQIVDYWPQLI